MVDNFGEPTEGARQFHSTGRPIVGEQDGFKAPPVLGHNDQSGDRLLIVNHNKEVEERVLRVLDDLREMGDAVDQRWLAIGRTHMEQAWMAVNRAVFRPGRVTLPENEALDPDFAARIGG